MTKNEVLNGVSALNSDEKNYVITVENDVIITNVKWMDATFFAPDQITDDMRNFKYMVKVHDNGKYSEIDESIETSSSVSGTGMNKKYKYFKGKSITFDKTVGVGRNKDTGETGVISSTFYSEDYKKPVREYLQKCGYKKKMSRFVKMILIISISVIVLMAAIFGILWANGVFENKEPISADEFITITENAGLKVRDESNSNEIDKADVDAVFVAEKENMYILFWDLKTEDFSKSMYSGNYESYSAEYSGTNTSVSGVNHDRAEINGADDEFVIISRIDDTMILAETTKEYKEDMEKILEELGY